MDNSNTTGSVTCHRCGHAASYDVSLDDLKRGKLRCEKCGGEIALGSVLSAKGAKSAGPLPLWKTVKAAAEGGGLVSLRCPSCNAASPEKMTIHELALKEHLFCMACGKEIPVDRQALQRTEEVLERLGVPSGSAENPTVRTPTAPPGIGPKRSCLAIVVAFGATIVLACGLMAFVV